MRHPHASLRGREDLPPGVTQQPKGVTVTEPHGADVEVDEVSVIYRTDTGPLTAVRPSSVRIKAGEFISLVGPSGCGKSTVMKVIAGLLQPSSGRVTIDSETVTGPHPSMGIVFQEALLLDWRNVIDNILLQADVRRLDRAVLRDRAEELLARVGLADFADKRPYELSGGMRQRVAICRALVHDPSLLLMDEPFGALDALTREQMNEDLQQLWMDLGMTIFFVTHSIPEAVLMSDRVLVMSARPGGIDADVTIALPRPREVRNLQKLDRYTDYVAGLRRTLDEVSSGGTRGERGINFE